MNVEQHYKTYITTQLDKLAAYDVLRPDGHVYEFHHHSKRVAQSIKLLASHMGYNDALCDALCWATLPHDIGKMALPIDIWDQDHKPTDDVKNKRRTHTSLGVEMVRTEFGDECDNNSFLKLLIDIMQNHHEHCNGTGHLGKYADNLTTEVRMACICDAFDGYSVHRPHFGDRDVSPKAVIKRMEIEKAGQFDQDILKIFKETIL